MRPPTSQTLVNTSRHDAAALAPMQRVMPAKGRGLPPAKLHDSGLLSICSPAVPTCFVVTRKSTSLEWLAQNVKAFLVIVPTVARLDRYHGRL